MKPISRDITITLVVKLVLLILLWWVCVKHFHPVIKSRSQWLMGVSEPPSSSSIRVHEAK